MTMSAHFRPTPGRLIRPSRVRGTSPPSSTNISDRRLRFFAFCGARPICRMMSRIVSTSSGVLSDRECRSRRIGGELLCTVD